jgi:hypothetical protein
MKTNFKAIAFALTLLSLPIGTAYGAATPPAKAPWYQTLNPWAAAAPTATSTTPAKIPTSTSHERVVTLGQEQLEAKKEESTMAAVANTASRIVAKAAKGLGQLTGAAKKKKCESFTLAKKEEINACENVCYFGRLWEYAPENLKIIAGRACGCYCAYAKKHPKAYEALKKYIPAL